MKYDEIKTLVKKHDFIEMLTIFQDSPKKYVITSISKDILKVAPIIEEDITSAICPIVAVPIDMISEIKKVGNHMLLFYSDLNNLHIEKAILSKNNNRRNHAKV
jgi:hypothetical protein